MSFNFHNLDGETRRYMLQELEADIANNKLYKSKRFNSTGNAKYPQLLREAIQNHDEIWLASELRRHGCFSSHESTQRGLRAVPVTAADTLADGEFNRFYMRGLCLKAQKDGISNVVIYRAKAVTNARSESQMAIGRSISVDSLLADLRNSVGIDTVFGLPSGPNSGLSIKLA